MTKHVNIWHIAAVAALLGIAPIQAQKTTVEDQLTAAEEALKEAEVKLGPESAEFARNIQAVGRIYHQRGRYNRAEELYRRALGIRTKALGTQDAEVAQTLRDLGALCELEGRYYEAEKYYQNALEIQEKALGPDHLDTISTVEHYARLLRHAPERKEEAEQLEARAFAARAEHIRQMQAPVESGGAAPLRIGGAVMAPRLISKVEPEYTEEARLAKHQGTAVLAIEVSADGQPRNIQLTRSVGFGLDEKAVQAVQQWRFEPGTREGQPVPVTATIEVNFRLL